MKWTKVEKNIGEEAVYFEGEVGRNEGRKKGMIIE